MAPNKHRIKLKGRLKRYTQTSVYLGILLILINLVIYLLVYTGRAASYLLYFDILCACTVHAVL